jgi:hypothetical protein
VNHLSKSTATGFFNSLLARFSGRLTEQSIFRQDWRPISSISW